MNEWRVVKARCVGNTRSLDSQDVPASASNLSLLEGPFLRAAPRPDYVAMVALDRSGTVLARMARLAPETL